MAKYLHPGSLDYYGISLDTPTSANSAQSYAEVDCAATMVTLLPDHGAEALMKAWHDCAMTEECIAPKGSDRENSRQDQSSLTILSALLAKDQEKKDYYKSCHMPIKEMRDSIGVWFHRFDAYVFFYSDGILAYDSTLVPVGTEGTKRISWLHYCEACLQDSSAMYQNGDALKSPCIIVDCIRL